MGSLTKNSTLDIDPSDPWANDALNRKAVGEYLKPIIASITQPFVISLDSPYGTGKTYFLKCLQQDFRNDGFKTVYFDAWTTDFSDDPLYAFMSAIKREFVLNGSDEQFEKNTVEKLEKKITCLTKAAGGFMRRRLGPALVRGAVEKMLGETGADKLLQIVALDSEDIADFFGEVAADALTAQEAAEESLEEFRKYLGELVKDVTAEQEEAEKQKIIIFVDELDRCRPNYAVEVLECIKHLFSVEGLVFVIAVDDTQLRNSISGVYGQNLDADGYLRRFIDWRLRLPKPSATEFAAFLGAQFKLNSVERLRSSVASYERPNEIIECFGRFAECFNLSLRQQERCFTEINLIVRSWPVGRPLFGDLLAALVVLHASDVETYAKAAANKLNLAELAHSLDEKFSSGESLSWWQARKSSFLGYFFSSNPDSAESTVVEPELPTLTLEQVREHYRHLPRRGLPAGEPAASLVCKVIDRGNLYV